MRHLKFNEDNKVVDLHTHPHLKSYMFSRSMNKRKFLSRFFKHKFWPFSHRSTLEEIANACDVSLATTYVLENEWVNDIPLIKFLTKLAPGFRKKVLSLGYYETAVAMMDHLEEGIASSGIVLSRTQQQLQANLKNNIPTLVHAVEGAHSLQSKETDWRDNCADFAQRGIASITLAHFYPNEFVKGCVFPYPEAERKHLKNYKKLVSTWDEDSGLTDKGVELVELMLEKKILIDVTHLSINGRKQVYDIVDHHNKDCAVFASHVGAKGVHRISYNLQDWELQWLGSRGCAVGIIFMNSWISPYQPAGNGLKHIEDTLSYIVNTAGADLPAIGTDLDGFTDPPDEIETIKDLPLVTKHLMDMGYGDDIIRRFLGGNAIRLLSNGWGNAKE